MIERIGESVPDIIDFTEAAAGSGNAKMADLVVATFDLKDEAATQRAIQQNIRNGHRYLVAVGEGNAPIGYASWHTRITARRHCCAEIAELGVHPDFRKRGIGTLLIRAAEQEILQGFPERESAMPVVIYVFSRADNAKATHFYLRNGYVIVSTQPFVLLPGVDISLFTKTRF